MHAPFAMAAPAIADKLLNAVFVVVCGDLLAGFDIADRHI